MKHICAKCDKPIEFGKSVVQMLEGPWYDAITPGFTSLLAEWHLECFTEFNFAEQNRPYACAECGGRIEFGERVSFLVIGKGTDSTSTVAENRGDTIFTPKHRPNCPNK
jgi:DNA-directed RNA polymerase subunit RPC12/RpoP